MSPHQPGASPRIGVLVVAYNAATTLTDTLDRIPSGFETRIDHVLVSDDASVDDTYEVGIAYRNTSTLPLTVIRQAENLGYGGNQKVGYRWAIEQGLDIVVLLHGDGQYAPEVIADLVEPLARGEADAVFGSRMQTPGAALKGGMPRYKYVGNRILTTFQNAMTGLTLSEWHSGYRAYDVHALAELDLDGMSDDFDFDTEIILALAAADKRIAEVPIPTYYGDEICYVNGLKYARDVTADVLRHKARRMGFGSANEIVDDAYELKASPHSSHGRLLSWLASKPAGRVLDVGCSDGRFAEAVESLGHTVSGIDIVKHPDIGTRVREFFEVDLNRPLPTDLPGDFDMIVAADVLEHTVDPRQVLVDLIPRLRPGGEILVSVPNFAHWYPRAKVASGRFSYDQRGLLDEGHVRFFTRRTFEELVHDSGMRIAHRDTVGSPVEVVERGGARGFTRAISVASAVDRTATRVWPTLFGYQFLYRLVRA